MVQVNSFFIHGSKQINSKGLSFTVVGIFIIMKITAIFSYFELINEFLRPFENNYYYLRHFFRKILIILIIFEDFDVKFSMKCLKN